MAKYEFPVHSIAMVIRILIIYCQAYSPHIQILQITATASDRIMQNGHHQHKYKHQNNFVYYTIIQMAIFIVQTDSNEKASANYRPLWKRGGKHPAILRYIGKRENILISKTNQMEKIPQIKL